MSALRTLLLACCLLAAGCHATTLSRCDSCAPCHAGANILPAGVYPTVVSPYTCAGVDVLSLKCQLQYQIDGGVDGLVLLGTIGEGHILNEQQRAQVIATAVHTAGGHLPVVVGIHTCNVQVALAQMQQARHLGATAVLVKYHGNPRASDQEVLAFFAALSDANILPILVYHYPSDTGLRLSAATIQAILRLANVIGIKESILNLHEVATQMMGCPDKLFFSATALDLTQFLKMGGHGFMCPEALILPRFTKDCYDAARTGCWDRARAQQEQLYELVPIYRRRPTSPAVTRTALMAAFDHQLPIPFSNEPSAVRLKEALNNLQVRTPTYSRSEQDALTDRDVHQIKRIMSRVGELAQ